MTKPEQCVCLATHKWADSCPHKILPVKYLSSFDKQNLSFQDLVSCKPAASALPEAAFSIQTKTLYTFIHLYQNVEILCFSLDFVMAFL